MGIAGPDRFGWRSNVGYGCAGSFGMPFPLADATYAGWLPLWRGMRVFRAGFTGFAHLEAGVVQAQA